MKTRYLKCLYTKGMFDDEYLIHINATNQTWCIVKREDVIKTDSKKGYVKCHPLLKKAKIFVFG